MDRRTSKLKRIWENGFWGKIIVVVVAGVVLGLVSSVIAIPAIYETKADALDKQNVCQKARERLEQRTCDRITQLEKVIIQDREFVDKVNEQMIVNSKLLERIDERTKRMDRSR